MSARRILVVDGANVVGSVPDGWWRDRPGAAARLHARLGDSHLAFATIVLVLEGQARGGVPEGTSGRVTTVHAPADGDDAIVAQCRLLAADAAVTLATADRGLIARVIPLGVAIVGPQALRAP